MSRFAGARAAVSRNQRAQGYTVEEDPSDLVRPSSSSSQTSRPTPAISLQRWAAAESPERYLKRFGYSVDGVSPQLSLHVIGHEEQDGHTFYELQCSLAWHGSGNDAFAIYLRGPPLFWRCKHRLQDLREELHDPVKEILNTEYVAFFEGAPFAHLGGLPGTTARLRAWLGKLAKCANSGSLPPPLCARALRFLEAPIPPNSEAALLIMDGRCTVCTLPLEEEVKPSSTVCKRCQADPSVDVSPRKVEAKSLSPIASATTGSENSL